MANAPQQLLLPRPPPLPLPPPSAPSETTDPRHYRHDHDHDQDHDQDAQYDFDPSNDPDPDALRRRLIALAASKAASKDRRRGTASNHALSNGQHDGPNGARSDPPDILSTHTTRSSSSINNNIINNIINNTAASTALFSSRPADPSSSTDDYTLALHPQQLPPAAPLAPALPAHQQPQRRERRDAAGSPLDTPELLDDPPTSTAAAKALYKQTKASRDELVERLAKDNMSLSQRLSQQYQINTDLKRLLLASVGDKVQTELEGIVQEKSSLAQHVQRLGERLQSDAEDIDELLNEVSLWQTKYEAIKVACAEAVRHRDSLSTRTTAAQTALVELLNERDAIRACLIESDRLLACLLDPMDEQVRREHYNTGALSVRTGVELSAMNRTLVQCLARQLYGSGAISAEVDERYSRLTRTEHQHQHQHRYRRQGLRSASGATSADTKTAAVGLGLVKFIEESTAAATSKMASQSSDGVSPAEHLALAHLKASYDLQAADAATLSQNERERSLQALASLVDSDSPEFDRVSAILAGKSFSAASSVAFDCCRNCKGPIMIV